MQFNVLQENMYSHSTKFKEYFVAQAMNQTPTMK